MLHWQYFIAGRKFLSTSMKAVVGTCACANSLYHLDFRLFIFGSHSQNQDESSVSLLQDKVYPPIFRGSCSNFELVRIPLIIWIAACFRFGFVHGAKPSDCVHLFSNI